MYYFYGIGDLVYIKKDDGTMPDSEKEKATLFLEELPIPPEHIKGKDRVLYIDPETKEIGHIYKDIIIFEETEE